MPASIKLQEELGSDVQVIFVECQGTQDDVWEAFAWKMKWMGNDAMWTTERPIPTVGKGLPEVALIGIDGKVIMQGYPGDFGKKFEEAVVAEIKKSKSAPEGTPKELEKAWQLFRKGDLAGALAECDKVTTDGAKALRTELIAMTSAKIERAKWLLDNGFIGEGEKLLNSLAGQVKADATLASAHSDQKSRLATPEMAKEREADKALTSLVGKIAKEKPFEPGNVKKAQSLAEKHSGTRAAERASRLVALAQVKVSL